MVIIFHAIVITYKAKSNAKLRNTGDLRQKDDEIGLSRIDFVLFFIDALFGLFS